MACSDCINEFSSNKILAFITLGLPVYFVSIFAGAYSTKQPPNELLLPTYVIIALLAISWLNFGVALLTSSPRLLLIFHFVYESVKNWAIVSIIIFLITGLSAPRFTITYILVGLIPLFLLLIPCHSILLNIGRRLTALRQLPAPAIRVDS